MDQFPRGDASLLLCYSPSPNEDGLHCVHERKRGLTTHSLEGYKKKEKREEACLAG